MMRTRNIEQPFDRMALYDTALYHLEQPCFKRRSQLFHDKGVNV